MDSNSRSHKEQLVKIENQREKKYFCSCWVKIQDEAVQYFAVLRAFRRLACAIHSGLLQSKNFCSSCINIIVFFFSVDMHPLHDSVGNRAKLKYFP